MGVHLSINVGSVVTQKTADRAVFIWVSKRNWFCINYATTGLENLAHWNGGLPFFSYDTQFKTALIDKFSFHV